MTDADFLLACLEERPHTLGELLARSFQERGHGLTVHSRAAELRGRGFDVRVERIPGRERGAGFLYSLGHADALDEGDRPLTRPPSLAGSAAGGQSSPSSNAQQLALIPTATRPDWA